MDERSQLLQVSGPVTPSYDCPGASLPLLVVETGVYFVCFSPALLPSRTQAGSRGIRDGLSALTWTLSTHALP